MRKRLPDKGFSLVVVLAASAITAVLILGVWFVWRQSQNRSRSAATGPSVTASSPGADKTTPRSDDSKESNYLVITEWGVKLPLSPDISGAYYKFRSERLADYVALYDTAFDRLHNANGISCGGPGAETYQLYSISRAKPENVAKLKESAGPDYQTFPFTKDYLFRGLGVHQAPPLCADLNSNPTGEFSPDTRVLDTLDNKERLFEDAFKRLQALP